MSYSLHVLSKCIFIACLISVTVGENVKGSIQLNSEAFNKIIPKFKAALIKFDKSHPFGPKHAQFKKVAEACISQSDLLVAEVNIQDYGKKENSDVAERYGVKSADYPEYRLFKEGDLDLPVTYEGDKEKADDIIRFVIKETGLWIGLPACIEELDVLARKFLTAAKGSSERKSILTKAKDARDRLYASDTVIGERASVYVKTMEKVMEAGEKFIEQELARVERLSEGKVSEKKKNQLKDRASILTSFQMNLKDEL